MMGEQGSKKTYAAVAIEIHSQRRILSAVGLVAIVMENRRGSFS
jgi:hypothetical protein